MNKRGTLRKGNGLMYRGIWLPADADEDGVRFSFWGKSQQSRCFPPTGNNKISKRHFLRSDDVTVTGLGAV